MSKDKDLPEAFIEEYIGNFVKRYTYNGVIDFKAMSRCKDLPIVVMSEYRKELDLDFIAALHNLLQ
jgi:hypothetical protein